MLLCLIPSWVALQPGMPLMQFWPLGLPIHLPHLQTHLRGHWDPGGASGSLHYTLCLRIVGFVFVSEATASSYFMLCSSFVGQPVSTGLFQSPQRRIQWCFLHLEAWRVYRSVCRKEYAWRQKLLHGFGKTDLACKPNEFHIISLIPKMEKKPVKNRIGSQKAYMCVRKKHL